MKIKQGWQCPICQKVWSPDIKQCPECKGEVTEDNSNSNQKLLLE